MISGLHLWDVIIFMPFNVIDDNRNKTVIQKKNIISGETFKFHYKLWKTFLIHDIHGTQAIFIIFIAY